MKPVWDEFLEKFGPILLRYSLDVILAAYTTYLREGEEEAKMFLRFSTNMLSYIFTLRREWRTW